MCVALRRERRAAERERGDPHEDERQLCLLHGRSFGVAVKNDL
jgi:hypothetical protein